MNHLVRAAFAGLNGIATRGQLLDLMPAWVIDHGVAAGEMIRVLPRVYATPALARDIRSRLRAALLFAGTGSALSHGTALAQFGDLHVTGSDRVHVTTPRDRDHRSTGFVVVHRWPTDTPPANEVVVRSGLRVVACEQSVIDYWQIASPADRRAPVFDAVRLGLASPTRLRDITQDYRRLRGRKELLAMLSRIADGCHSELELLGFSGVFADRRLPRAERQWEVAVRGRTYLLDVAWPRLMLAIELDGAAYHSSNAARERDLRRDAALASAGWLVIRISYSRLRTEPGAVLDQLLDAISVRRSQLRRAS